MAENELEARLLKKIKFLEARINLLSASLERVSAKVMNKSQVLGTVKSLMLPLDHGELDGLEDDDHSGYPWMQGRSGGQEIYGGTDSGDDIKLYTTKHVTKGSYYLPDIIAAGYIKIDGSGVLSSSTTITIPVYSQDDEPTLTDNSIALWVETDAGPDYYLIGRFGSVQKKIELV